MKRGDFFVFFFSSGRRGKERARGGVKAEEEIGIRKNCRNNERISSYLPFFFIQEFYSFPYDYSFFLSLISPRCRSHPLIYIYIYILPSAASYPNSTACVFPRGNYKILRTRIKHLRKRFKNEIFFFLPGVRYFNYLHKLIVVRIASRIFQGKI